MKYIKLFSFCALVFFIISISKASADIKNVMEQDGVTWIGVSESYKIGYVCGFLSGSILARQEFLYVEEDFKKEWKKIQFEEKWVKFLFPISLWVKLKMGLMPFIKILVIVELK